MSDPASIQANSGAPEAGDYLRMIAAAKERSEKVALTADWISAAEPSGS